VHDPKTLLRRLAKEGDAELDLNVQLGLTSPRRHQIFKGISTRDEQSGTGSKSSECYNSGTPF